MKTSGARVVRACVWTMAAFAVVAPLFEAHAVSPRRLAEVADLSGLVVSPDGRQMAFRMDQPSVERNTSDSVWYVQDMDGKAPPRRVGEGGVPLRNSSGGALPAVAQWSQDGHSIFYRALLEGRIDVWRAASDGSGAEALTGDPADIRDFWVGEDGRTLRYSVGATRAAIVEAEQGEYERGIHVDATIPVGQGVYRSGQVDGRLATQRFTGLGFDREGLLAGAAERWIKIDLHTGQRHQVESSGRPQTHGAELNEHTPDRTVADAHSARTAVLTRALAAGGPYSEPIAALSVVDEHGRNAISCTAPACVDADITSVQWRHDHQEVIFTTSALEDGRAQTIYRWRLDTGEVMEVARSRGLLNGGRELSSACGVAADAVLCVAAEADRPPRLERIEIDTGHRQVLFDPNAALAFDLERRVTTRFLRWQDPSGHEFTGQLLVSREPAAQPRPLFVTYYTCSGFLRGGTGDEWPLASFAEAGIAALCITAQPHKPNAITRYDEGLSAIRSVVDLLAGEGVVDASRVGMGGFSFGSEVTLWVAAESDLLAAASVTSPAVTPLYHLMGSLQGDRFFEGLRAAWALDAPDAMPEEWKRLSLAFNRDRIRAPVLLQMPEQEYLYALDYIIPMVRENQADLYLFPTAPHMKFEPRHKVAAYERNLDWFRYWLQDVESNRLEKEAQYARWRLMRQKMEAQPFPRVRDGLD